MKVVSLTHRQNTQLNALKALYATLNKSVC